MTFDARFPQLDNLDMAEGTGAPKGLALWVRATRAPFLQASIIPVVAGAAIAFDDGRFLFTRFLLALVAMVCVHFGVNMANDYYDHLAGADEAHPSPTPFSGGSRVIQEGWMRPSTVIGAALVFFAVGTATGLVLVAMTGPVLLWIGLLGVLLGFLYTAPPLKLVYRGVGEPFVFLLLGPLAVLGGWYVHDGPAAAIAEWGTPLFASVPIGIMVMLILLANEFPDAISDASAGKRHLVVVLGAKRSAGVFTAAIYVMFLAVAVGLVVQQLPLTMLLLFLLLPQSLRLVRMVREGAVGDSFPVAAQAGTIQLDLLVGLVTTIAFVVGAFFSR